MAVWELGEWSVVQENENENENEKYCPFFTVRNNQCDQKSSE
jgi:hypothetical protein